MTSLQQVHNPAHSSVLWCEWFASEQQHITTRVTLHSRLSGNVLIIIECWLKHFCRHLKTHINMLATTDIYIYTLFRRIVRAPVT